MLDLSRKTELRWLGALIADVRAAAPRATFLIAGATARDLILKYGHGIDTGRATEDVDLAFAIADWAEFERLREALLRSGRFAADGRELQRVRHSGVGRCRVDIIPFAGVEDRQRNVAWPPDGSHVMNVIGMREALATAETVRLPGAQEVPAVSLPALALLKLVAWKARRLTESGKDAPDFRLLLRHYLDAGNQERLHTEAGHLVSDENFDYERASAWLMGRDSFKVASASEAPKATQDYFRRLIETEVTAGVDALLLGDMRSAAPGKDLVLIRSFHEGFA